MHLYCDFCTWLQAKLYNGELFSSMSCAMVSVMLLVHILLSTLHSINLWTCLLSSVFSWGQAKSKLGGVDTPNFIYHNLPLFIDICLIMRYYLWLFICLCMLDDSWRMDSRSLDSDGKEGILMQFRKDLKNTRKIIFFQKTEEARRRDEEGPQGAHTP